jgi:hypothetical protein
MYGRLLGLFNSKAIGHLLEEKALAGTVGLDPLSVNHKLGNGPFAGVFDDFRGSAGIGFNINVSKRDVVLLQKALGDAALGTPKSGIDGDLHGDKSGRRLTRAALNH